MHTKVVNIPTTRIVGWDSFHDVFDEALVFPGYYGRNMNAWIDCLTYAGDAKSGMIAEPVACGDLLALSLNDAADFNQRCPEQFNALIECTAFVKYRRRDVARCQFLLCLSTVILNGIERQKSTHYLS